MTPDPEGRRPQHVYAVAAYNTHDLQFYSLEIFADREQAQAHRERMAARCGQENVCMAERTISAALTAPDPEAAVGALARELSGEVSDGS